MINILDAWSLSFQTNAFNKSDNRHHVHTYFLVIFQHKKKHDKRPDKIKQENWIFRIQKLDV